MVQIVIRVPESENSISNGPAEWAIIELQGDLESRSGEALDGSFVGDLHYSKKGIPILIIGHHIMYGKFTKLEKPLVVLQRERTMLSDDLIPNEIEKESPNQFSCLEKEKTKSVTSTEYFVKAVIKKKLLFKTRPKPIVSNIPKKI